MTCQWFLIISCLMYEADSLNRPLVRPYDLSMIVHGEYGKLEGFGINNSQNGPEKSVS